MDIGDARMKRVDNANREQRSRSKDNSDRRSALIAFLMLIIMPIIVIVVSLLFPLRGYDMDTYTTSLSAMYMYIGLYSVTILLLVILGVYYFISSCVSVRRALGAVDRRLSSNRYIHMYRVSVSDKVSRKRLVRLGKLVVVYVLILLASFVMAVLGNFFSNPQFYLPYYIFADFVDGVETETVTYISDTRGMSTYSRARRNPTLESYELRYSYWVNFQTSNGEIMTIQTSSDYIDEFRTFNNTEISYYPRTRTYVSSN